jgi:hypothetical protein
MPPSQPPPWTGEESRLPPRPRGGLGWGLCLNLTAKTLIIRAGGQQDGTKTLSRQSPVPPLRRHPHRQKRQQKRTTTLGLPHLQPLLRRHLRHTDVPLAQHPHRSRPHPAGGDAPREPERRRRHHRTQARDHRAVAARRCPARGTDYRGVGAGSPLDGRGGRRVLVVCQKICPAQRRPCSDRTALGVPKCGSRHALCGGVGVCGFGGRGSPAGGGADAATDGGAGGGIVAQ